MNKVGSEKHTLFNLFSCVLVEVLFIYLFIYFLLLLVTGKNSRDADAGSYMFSFFEDCNKL